MEILTRAILVTCLVASLGTGSLAITCLSCGDEGQRSLSDCSSIIECEPEHTCYVEQVLSLPDLSPKFKAGCRDKHHCNLIKCNIELSRNTSVSVTKVPHSVGRRDLTVCTQCCYNDTCNVKGCGGAVEKKTSTGDKLLQCYTCTKLRDSSPCMDFTTCQLGEFCSSEYRPHDDGNPYYHLGCMKHKYCEILKNISMRDNTTLETKCCGEQLCNQSPYSVATNTVDSVQPLEDCPKDLVQTKPPTTQATTAVPIKTTSKPAATQPTPAASKSTTTTAQPTPAASKSTTTTTNPTPAASKVSTTTAQPTPASSQSTTTTAPSITTTMQSTTTTTKPTTTTTQPTKTTKTTPTTQTTTTTSTTAKPTTAVVSKASRQCQVCDGPPQICEQAYTEATCTFPNNYCINKLVNTQLGSRTVERKCGNLEECQREWYQGTSDNDRCLNFDPRYVQTLNFDCTFCCVEDNCNIPVVPDAWTLYRT